MELDKFINYLKNDKKTADNTCEAYQRDINAFSAFVNERGGTDIDAATNTDVVSYLMEMKNSGKSMSTVNRRLASLRAYYKYLIKENKLKINPAEDIKSPKIKRKELDYLSVEEIEMLLEAPDDSIKGIRDKAILELMYATGIRVSELIELKVSDVNLRMGFVTCDGQHGRARIVPMGKYARQALDAYINKSRKGLMRDKDGSDVSSPFFVNYRGEAFTRQGLWKILKHYGEKTGLEDRITPHILRSSFAVHMVQNGADLKSLQELMGHEDVMALQIYLSFSKNRIKDVYDRTHPRA